MNTDPGQGTPADAAARRASGGVSLLALNWLREVLRSEFAGTRPLDSAAAAGAGGREVNRLAGANRIPDFLLWRDPFNVAGLYRQGDVENALRYREWYRRWRLFQRPDQLQRFIALLDRAGAPEEVYQALTEHAVQIVGGYTCLLFPPQADKPLRPLPNPTLRGDAGRLTISVPLPQPGLIGRHDLESIGEGALANLAPLFSEERAVSLAHAPFGEGGVILLVERRRERVFEAEDWELLRLLSAHGAAALTRLRLASRVGAAASASAERLADRRELAPVVEHALAIARQGTPLTVSILRLEGLEQLAAEDGPAAVGRVRRTAAEVLRELTGALGIAVARDPEEFVLVLPRLTSAQAESLAARLARQLPARVQVRVGSARHHHEDDDDTDAQTASALLARAEAALELNARAVPKRGSTAYYACEDEPAAGTDSAATNRFFGPGDPAIPASLSLRSGSGGETG